jgi:hypothetical protein
MIGFALYLQYILIFPIPTAVFCLLPSSLCPFLRPLKIFHRCAIVWLPQETIKQNPVDRY